jgi:TPR repeat protein
MKIQPSEFINKNKLQFAEGNAIKYICRHGSKGQKQDLEKAKHYIDMIIDRDYGDDAEKSKVFLSGLPESDKDSMDDLSEGFKVTYSGDDLNNDIFYPSGVSVGQEGFDE